jgi:hypothetical protein
MKHVQLKFDEKAFNLLWRSLHDREAALLETIQNEPANSDKAALLSNDVVYLRLYKAELEKIAQEANMPDSVFALDDDIIDLEFFSRSQKKE